MNSIVQTELFPKSSLNTVNFFRKVHFAVYFIIKFTQHGGLYNKVHSAGGLYPKSSLNTVDFTRKVHLTLDFTGLWWTLYQAAASALPPALSDHPPTCSTSSWSARSPSTQRTSAGETMSPTIVDRLLRFAISAHQITVLDSPPPLPTDRPTECHRHQ